MLPIKAGQDKTSFPALTSDMGDAGQSGASQIMAVREFSQQMERTRLACSGGRLARRIGTDFYTNRHFSQIRPGLIPVDPFSKVRLNKLSGQPESTACRGTRVVYPQTFARPSWLSE
jgi:hypothetical protein